MELSMTIALIAALAIREFTTSLFILFFVLGAGFWSTSLLTEDVGLSRTSFRFCPNGLLVRTRCRRDRRAADCRSSRGRCGCDSPCCGDFVDGVVVLGQSTVDQSSITGESKPAEKAPGAGFAGTTNHGRPGDPTERWAVIPSLDGSSMQWRRPSTPAPVQKLADRLAGWLVSFRARFRRWRPSPLPGICGPRSLPDHCSRSCGIAANSTGGLGAIGRAAAAEPSSKAVDYGALGNRYRGAG